MSIVTPREVITCSLITIASAGVGFSIGELLSPSIADIRARNTQLEACAGSDEQSCAIELLPDLQLVVGELALKREIVTQQLTDARDDDPEQTVFDRRAVALAQGGGAGVISILAIQGLRYISKDPPVAPTKSKRLSPKTS